MNTQEWKSVRDIVAYTFRGDEDIFKYYDPSKPEIKDCIDIGTDITEKIDWWDKNMSGCHFVAVVYNANAKIENDVKFNPMEIIGYYFVCMGTETPLLISFGLNVKFRDKRSGDMLFQKVIDKMMGKPFFQCSLFRKNTRAINYLKKQKMYVVQDNELLPYITLQFNMPGVTTGKLF